MHLSVSRSKFIVSRSYKLCIHIETDKIFSDSEPQFNSTDSLSIDDPANLTCSLKFAGDAWVSMRMTNSAGEVLAEINKRITTNVLQQSNLPYTTSSAIEKIYFCNISLANDSSDPKTIIFSRNLTRTVQCKCSVKK